MFADVPIVVGECPVLVMSHYGPAHLADCRADDDENPEGRRFNSRGREPR